MWGKIKEAFGLDERSYGEYYVYLLLDPRYNPMRVFYVGYGKHERMHDHEKETRRLLKRGKGYGMAWHCKHKRIKEIFDSGAIPTNCAANCIPTQVVFRSDNEAEVLRRERELIEEYGLENLTNETYGYSEAGIASYLARKKRRVRK